MMVMASKTSQAPGGRKKRPTPSLPAVPGMEGHKEFERQRRIPGTRQFVTTRMRARPGTFQWRYGRAKPNTELDVLFAVGSHVAELFEAAEIGRGAAGFMEPSGSLQWRGLPPAQIEAIQSLVWLSQRVGMAASSRLRLYCAEGKTAAEIAWRFGARERAMGHVLEQDLRDAAQVLGYTKAPI